MSEQIRSVLDPKFGDEWDRIFGKPIRRMGPNPNCIFSFHHESHDEMDRCVEFGCSAERLDDKHS